MRRLCQSWDMKRVLPLIASAGLLLVGCSSSDSNMPATNPPSTDSDAASPTDPANTIVPTSSAAKDDPAEGTPSTESVTIEIDVDSDELPVTASVNVGSPVTIHVVSAESHEFHLHGYDIELEGTEVTFDFTADQVGDFELETHDTEEVLLELSVVAD